MTRSRRFVFSFVILLVVSSCGKKEDVIEETNAPAAPQKPSGPKKKVLYIDSYHQGYGWSDGITSGVLKELNATLTATGDADSSSSAYTLRIHRMDTKRNNTPEFIEKAGQDAKKLIDSWMPDVVIAADDNASKHIIEKYYKNSATPFVFCGLNWDETIYGFPCSNVTGMIEVALVPDMVKTLTPFAKGKRLGFLGPDNETSRKEAEYFGKKYGLVLDSRFVKNFADWKVQYKSLQTDCDILFVDNNAGIAGWVDMEAEHYVKTETQVPSASIYDFMAPFALVTYAKVASEQGQWAAKTAKEILAGKAPSEISVGVNKEAQIFLNMGLAEKLGITFPVDLMERSVIR